MECLYTLYLVCLNLKLLYINTEKNNLPTLSNNRVHACLSGEKYSRLWTSSSCEKWSTKASVGLAEGMK